MTTGDAFHAFHAFRCFGLRFRSEVAIPWVLEDPGDAPPDVRIRRADLEDGGRSAAERLIHVARERGPEVEPGLKVFEGPDSVRWEYADGTRFRVDAAGREVEAAWPAHFTVGDMATYLLGPILRYILRRRGIVPLHAGAVEIDGSAVAFLGPPGAGKSTLVASLAGLGHPVLTDDVLALSERDGRIAALPAYPIVRLWPDSARRLFGAADALPLMTPNWEKRFLDLRAGGYRFADRELPPGAIYLLEPPVEDAGVSIAAAPPAATLPAVLGNASARYVLDREARAREFRLVTRLLSEVPVRRVRRGAVEPAALARAVVADVRSAAGAGVGGP